MEQSNDTIDHLLRLAERVANSGCKQCGGEGYVSFPPEREGKVRFIYICPICYTDYTNGMSGA